MSDRPNVMFVMTDQQRFDTIATLGNSLIHTPNLDRLVRRGVSFRRAYSTCPVCVPARYTIRTGCEPAHTGQFMNGLPRLVEGQPETMEGRCGPYLARTMRQRGYRTFGIGKFHTVPRYEDLGYDVHLHSEELPGGEEDIERDGYWGWIRREHPAYAHIEQLHGERTEMYYMPQLSPLPAELTVEAWAADRAVEQVKVEDDRPFFGFVSFIGPHPPLAPPVPFNRMYDPDRMPAAVRGDRETDLADDFVDFMNYGLFTEGITDPVIRVLRARYYGEISYIDQCLGRILDAVEARPDADNTVICFFSDHGEFLGDHHAWNKESYFEASAHVPMLVSWPARLPANERRDEVVCLTDLFGIATHASGEPETRDGIDVLGMLAGDAPPRDHLVGMHGHPGTKAFKVMVLRGPWKYWFLANGGREQLFNLEADPNELHDRAAEARDVAADLRQRAIAAAREANATPALDGDDLRTFDFEPWPRRRIYQFNSARGVTGFPERPGDVVG